MPLFAELSAEGWTVIIAAAGIIVTKLWSMWLEYLRDKDQRKRDTEAAAKLEVVHQATNGMSAKLEAAAFAQGAKQEKDAGEDKAAALAKETELIHRHPHPS